MSFTIISRMGFYATLFAVTLLAFSPSDKVVLTTGWDKTNHCLAFFVLLGFLDRAYPELLLWKKIVLLIGYGMFIEIVQAYLPSRHFSFLDVIADSIGLSLYFIVRFFLLRKFFLIQKENLKS